MQGATHTHKAAVPPNGFKCLSCLGLQFMNQCQKEFDDTHIAKNREACGADLGRGGRGGRGGHGNRGGCGGHGGRGGSAYTGYGRGQFSVLAKE